ncbi:MAG: family 20 glycosylhydrolase [Lachnospiraceae bacterium]|nr:family 20 glycosylhydrolase [Lachnospiraceae bacterium]
MINFIPQPKYIHMTKEHFLLNYSSYIVLEDPCTGQIPDLRPAADCADRDHIYRQAEFLRNSVEATVGFRLHLTKGKAREGDIRLVYLKNTEAHAEEYYEVSITEKNVEIRGHTKSLIWGIQTFLQILEQTGAYLPGLEIKDEPVLQNRGFYHDVSRGRVPKLEALKELVNHLSRYKINQLQLYMEHTYLFRDFSEVWRDDTPVTPEEILELDAWCYDRGVELVPSISTCSHLYKVLRTQQYKNLCELENSDQEPHSARDRQLHHTVDISNPDSLELVKRMLDEYRPLFRSDKFNICADETFDMGHGRSHNYCEEKGVGRAYVEFTRNVCEHVKKLGSRPMMWGDIIVKYPELLSEFPDDVVFLNWGYDAGITDETTRVFAGVGAKFYNCPGVSGWSRLVNDNKTGYENIRRMASYAKKYGAVGLLNTDWGDYYHFSHPEYSYPGMIYGAQLSWGDEISREELNRSLSVLEFGSPQEDLAEQICQISDCCLYRWMDFCTLKENQNDTELTGAILREGFDNAQKANHCDEANQRLEEIKRVLSGRIPAVRPDRREQLAAYLLATDSVLLFNHLGKMIYTKEILSRRNQAAEGAVHQENSVSLSKSAGYPDEDSERKDRWTLAEKLEKWLFYYKDLYRKHSRESELNLLQDVVTWYCDYLRKGYFSSSH